MEQQLKTKRFSIQGIEHSDKLVQVYTGLQNAKLFYLLTEKLREKADRLHYVRGSETDTIKKHQLGKDIKNKTHIPKQHIKLNFKLDYSLWLYAFIISLLGDCPLGYVIFISQKSIFLPEVSRCETQKSIMLLPHGPSY